LSRIQRRTPCGPTRRTMDAGFQGLHRVESFHASPRRSRRLHSATVFPLLNPDILHSLLFRKVQHQLFDFINTTGHILTEFVNPEANRNPSRSLNGHVAPKVSAFRKPLASRWYFSPSTSISIFNEGMARSSRLPTNGYCETVSMPAALGAQTDRCEPHPLTGLHFALPVRQDALRRMFYRLPCYQTRAGLLGPD